SPVLWQAWLLPMAFTMEATHDGPLPSVLRAWSDWGAFGITQLTFASLQFWISVRTVVCGITTWFTQSAPVQTSFPFCFSGTHMCLIASGAVQIEPAVGV